MPFLGHNAEVFYKKKQASISIKLRKLIDAKIAMWMQDFYDFAKNSSNADKISALICI